MILSTKKNTFIGLLVFACTAYVYAEGPKWPDDPWYMGPDYNDVDDAKNYAKDALELSKKVSGKPMWIEPSDALLYSQMHCVGAHNAHVYKRWFNTVYQQRHSTTHQLYYGVRGLMWDTYSNDSVEKQGPPGAKIILSHGEPGFVAFTQKGRTTYQTFQYELRRVLDFMKNFPKAVITIILEDYASGPDTEKEIIALTNSLKYDPIFTPKDYDSEVGKPKGWPTLGWMRSNNKRLVIFTQRARNTSKTFNQFTYCRENQYSTTDPNELCKERSESKNRKPWQEIIIFNNFSAAAVTHAARSIKGSVEYKNVKALVQKCQKEGWKPFNQYYADRIIDCCNELIEGGEKTVFQYVNELNGN